MTNFLPAVLLAATPHNGKSVLAYLLSRELRQRRVPHILLRAAPDGEGDWFYESPDEVRIALRRKGTFNARLVADMRRAIQNRRLPMLVDIGGRPQGEQFDILTDCTHVIHLFRDDNDRAVSGAWLEPLNLIPVAELQSQLKGDDVLRQDNGILRGVITALDRGNPRPGVVFARLVERVTGLFAYTEDELEALHCRDLPDDTVLVTAAALASRLNAFAADGSPQFEPSHLARLPGLVGKSPAIALYGRMPMWLVAGIAALTAPAQLYWFDARHYGWVMVPSVRRQAHGRHREFSLTPQAEGDAIRLVYARQPGITVLSSPRSVKAPQLPTEAGVILDGPMPGWLWAALARAYRRHPWLAAREPRHGDVRFWPLP
ncbi:MAG: CRISPR-associated protein Csx3 [Anaerolineae bacterium]|nr:CRISPR-associated protein Csx3 [Anaerolineae bacterium]